jgi:hypothetical protein
MTIIGPPHLGQSQRWLDSLAVDAPCSVCGCCTAPKAKWQESGASPVSEEAEVPNADEAFGKHVQQEAAQELIER